MNNKKLDWNYIFEKIDIFEKFKIPISKEYADKTYIADIQITVDTYEVTVFVFFVYFKLPVIIFNKHIDIHDNDISVKKNICLEMIEFVGSYLEKEKYFETAKEFTEKAGLVTKKIKKL